MIFLIASIICSSSLTLLFKLYEKLKIPTFQVIVFNYLSASLIGFYISDDHFSISFIVNQDWFFITVIMGILFIGLFNAIAFTAQNISIATATVANKMSFIIPVIVAVILYDDALTFLKITGVIVAIVAVYLSFYRKEKNQVSTKYFMIPVIVFLGCGLLDTLINYAQVTYLKPLEYEVFLFSAFGTAGLIGTIILFYRIVFQKESFRSKSIVPGVILGTVNFCSMYAMVIALNSQIFSPAVFFSINNIGIVIFSIISAFLLFKENLGWINWTGVFLCLVSIALIAFS